MQPAPLHAGVAGGPEGGRALWLRTADGMRLRAGLWSTGGRGTVLLFPGRTEVVEKYGQVAAVLAGQGWGVLTLDWRGQGLSDRPPGGDPGLGHVRRFAEYQQDVAALQAAAVALGLARPWVLLAHSMGACIGLRAMLGGLPVAVAAFSAPMWGLPLRPGLALALRGAGAVARVTGRSGRAVPGERSDFALAAARFDDNFLTTDRDQFARMQMQVHRHPELGLGAPTLGWLAAALAEMADLARCPAPALPAWAGLGSREKIVSPEAVQARMAAWPGGRLELFHGAEHELMMEAPQHRRRFLDATAALFAAATG